MRDTETEKTKQGWTVNADIETSFTEVVKGTMMCWEWGRTGDKNRQQLTFLTNIEQYKNKKNP
ncbi:hypothetical protein BRE01_54300 [Brevibacillus reuszeri]|uniref:Uncharacterized protein n=1 Tax=Brevibacillus reuszeri TaxID=54915 RepID=A0ABQ0TV03_9BACL|nr:hypothetical protein BRE01_54300 [Brevibacillus reuszeri]